MGVGFIESIQISMYGVIDGQEVHKFIWWEILQSLATTSVLCRLTKVHRVHNFYAPAYLCFMIIGERLMPGLSSVQWWLNYNKINIFHVIIHTMLH